MDDSRKIEGLRLLVVMQCSRGRALLLAPVLVLLIVSFASATVERKRIPTTLEGPFKPYTKEFDSSLRSGSDDLPLYDPRVVKRVPAIFPEQIFIALSTPDAMWMSWVSGRPSQLIASLFLVLKVFGFARVCTSQCGFLMGHVL